MMCLTSLDTGLEQLKLNQLWSSTRQLPRQLWSDSRTKSRSSRERSLILSLISLTLCIDALYLIQTTCRHVGQSSLSKVVRVCQSSFVSGLRAEQGEAIYAYVTLKDSVTPDDNTVTELKKKVQDITPAASTGICNICLKWARAPWHDSLFLVFGRNDDSQTA